MVMGPVVGGILVELGAEVVKIEPVGGDATRELLGSGAGYFPMYNRGKKSVVSQSEGPARTCNRSSDSFVRSDVLIENFRPGALDATRLVVRLAWPQENPRLIHCSLKGFLAGPYAQSNRTRRGGADDGRLGVHDRTTGAALTCGRLGHRRNGRHVWLSSAFWQHSNSATPPAGGKRLRVRLFETTVYLVGQHMAQLAVTGDAAKPMPVRVSAWAIYDVFEVRETASRCSSASSPIRSGKHSAPPSALDALAAESHAMPPTNSGCWRVHVSVAARARAAGPIYEVGTGSHALGASRPAVRADQSTRGSVRRSSLAHEWRTSTHHPCGRTHDSSARCCRWTWARRGTRRSRSLARRRANTRLRDTHKLLGLGTQEIAALAADRII